MAGFEKPKPLKAALKVGLYGPAGSGKTFTSLLLAEGLARYAGKRVAFCDTEHGTAFYSQHVPERAAHPDAFDFDVLHTKSITEVLAAVQALDQEHFGVLVIDSITHLWDACRNAYNGKLTRAGTIPLHAWGAIKKPYKDLVNLLLSLPTHVLICGRQAIDYGEDEGTGELKNLGFRMRAEGETPYEPDVLLRLESHKATKKASAVPIAHVEKDRTGVLAGRSIEWPSYDALARPLLGLLGATQAAVASDEEVGLHDAEALARQESERERASAVLAEDYENRFRRADDIGGLERVARELTAAVKRRLTGADLERVRGAYGRRLAKLKVPAEVRSNGVAGPADRPTATAATIG